MTIDTAHELEPAAWGERDLAPPRELLDRAWAFEDPDSYRAGVREALEWASRGRVTASASVGAGGPRR